MNWDDLTDLPIYQITLTFGVLGESHSLSFFQALYGMGEVGMDGETVTLRVRWR